MPGGDFVSPVLTVVFKLPSISLTLLAGPNTSACTESLQFGEVCLFLSMSERQDLTLIENKPIRSTGMPASPLKQLRTDHLARNTYMTIM